MTNARAGRRSAARIDRMTVDPDRWEVTVDGEAATLTYLGYQLLFALIGASGRVVAYEVLAMMLWSEDVPHPRRRLAVLVSRLRSALGPAGSYIETVQRVGYRLRAGRPPSEA